MTHWAEGYLGTAWTASNDCWAFFRRVQLEQFARVVPEIHVNADDVLATVRGFTAHAERQRWVPTQAPVEGDAVLMSQSAQPTHIGLWLALDGGGVLHNVRGSGVVFTRADRLHAQGYNITGFYRFTGSA